MLNDIASALEGVRTARNKGVKPTAIRPGSAVDPPARRRGRNNNEGDGDGLEPAPAAAGPGVDRDQRPQADRAVRRGRVQRQIHINKV